MRRRGKYTMTPLMIAAMGGNAEQVRSVLAAGAVVDEPDRDGRTALTHAVIEGHANIVQLLLDAGASVNMRDFLGETPLHCAAKKPNVEVVRQLLDAGAQVDAQDRNGNTPLMDAVFSCSGQGDIIGLLRASGASPVLANAHGQTPAGLARLIANYDIAQFFVDVGVS